MGDEDAHGDAVPVGIAFFDVDQRFRFANKSHETFTGRSPTDMVGMTLAEAAWAETYNPTFPRWPPTSWNLEEPVATECFAGHETPELFADASARDSIRKGYIKWGHYTPKYLDQRRLDTKRTALGKP